MHSLAVERIAMPADDNTRWTAVLERDPESDGEFVFAVRTTGIYCRPSCPARRPLRDRVAFYEDAAEAEAAGFRACLRCRPRAVREDAAWARRVCGAIESGLDAPLRLEALAARFDTSARLLQRRFGRIVGVTPRQYADARRLRAVKAGLKRGQEVTAALHDAGYGSGSRLYERSDAQLGMTPATYGRGGRGMRIGFTVVACPLGRLLVASTERGVAAVSLGESDAKLTAALAAEYPAADLRRDDRALRRTVSAILAHLDGRRPSLDLPLDVVATAFERRVWEELRRIPYGETRSYGQVALAIGVRDGARAVARACARNRTALVVPCHRVVASDGSPSGYRWGARRKRALLDRESRARTSGARESDVRASRTRTSGRR
jgi:AraC family transcriptional regulator of adaptative response/methylated-DNA-[protein]-cysteine methyltransferase